MYEDEILAKQIKAEFPDFEIILKSNSFVCMLIDIFLKAITFGKMSSFMTRFVTTIGNKVYVPDGWASRDYRAKYLVLYHERVHMRQRKKYGTVLYGLLYLFVLPVVFAYWRMKFEIEAYAEDIVESNLKYGYPLFGFRFNVVVKNLSGPNYFWTCVFEKYLRKQLTVKIFDVYDDRHIAKRRK